MKDRWDEDRKLLIKRKNQSFTRFRVHGCGGGCAAFFIGRCPKVVFKSRVTSHNNDMSSPLEKGRAKGAGWICHAGASFYVAENVLLAGIVSHAWYEILRLSPHLFWLGVFTHGVFSSAQDDGAWGADGLTGRRHRCLFRRGYSRIDDLIPSHQSLATSRQSRQRQDAIFPTLLDGYFLFML